MIETAFLYFFRRSLSILEGIYRDPKKLTVFLLLILVSAILSIRECRKDRDGERPIWDKAFANTLWLSLGLGLPLACALQVAGSCSCVMRMKRIGRALLLLGKYVLYPFKYHLVEVHNAKSDWTATLWTVLFGFWVSMLEALLGLFYCLSLIGIPFGIRHLKLAVPLWGPCRFRILSDLEFEELMETKRGGLER